MKFKKSIAAFGLAVCVLAQPAKAEQSKENCKTYRLSAGHDRATLAATNFTITNDGPESVVIETDGDQSLREIIEPSNNSEVNGFAGDPRFTYFVRLAKADGRSTITVCSHAGELDDAEAAYDRGDYATALQLLQPLAERGVANAQMLTGVMYAYGLGVSQDYAEALEWFRKSAEQNHPIAQYYLGVTYAESKGVRQDFAEALKWFLKAAANTTQLRSAISVSCMSTATAYRWIMYRRLCGGCLRQTGVTRMQSPAVTSLPSR